MRSSVIKNVTKSFFLKIKKTLIPQFLKTLVVVSCHSSSGKQLLLSRWSVKLTLYYSSCPLCGFDAEVDSELNTLAHHGSIVISKESGVMTI